MNINDPMQQGKILVVDDDRLVLATVVHGLAEAGYVVIDADNGDDAILLAREHRPDLALLDIRMEGKSGFDVAAYLREYLQMPFMFLSAFADDETVAQVKALGAVAYLVKPLDIRQIVPAVQAAFVSIRADRGIADLNAQLTTQFGSQLGVEPDLRPAALQPSTPAVHPQVDIALDPPAGNGARDLLGDQVAMAVGVLMHRYSLLRGDALSRLRHQAAADGHSVEAHAEALLKAIELLSMPSSRP
jgi:CheY-like chemotaxis protein